MQALFLKAGHNTPYQARTNGCDGRRLSGSELGLVDSEPAPPWPRITAHTVTQPRCSAGIVRLRALIASDLQHLLRRALGQQQQSGARGRGSSGLRSLRSGSLSQSAATERGRPCTRFAVR